MDVFFVLSGYLITWLLVREHDRIGAINRRQFYVRRLLRLYPAMIVAMLAAFVLAEHFGWGVPGWDLLASVTYTMDFYGSASYHFSPMLHTWSLAVEEQFYLVWPALLIVALRRNWNLYRMVSVLIATSVAITAFIGLAHIGHSDRVQYLPCSHIAELGLGALLAFAMRDGRIDELRRLSSASIVAACLIGLVVCLVMLPSVWWAFPAVAILCWPPVAHLVTHRESRISKTFSWTPAVWLGERSYAFYLWHYPLVTLVFFENWGHRRVVNALIALALTLVVVATSWVVIETPFLKLKDRFEPPDGPPRPPGRDDDEARRPIPAGT